PPDRPPRTPLRYHRRPGRRRGGRADAAAPRRTAGAVYHPLRHADGGRHPQPAGRRTPLDRLAAPVLLPPVGPHPRHVRPRPAPARPALPRPPPRPAPPPRPTRGQRRRLGLARLVEARGPDRRLLPGDAAEPVPRAGLLADLRVRPGVGGVPPVSRT